ncbi:MAG: hypothetical protein P1V20_10650 [Verrucomicrobiales bacterium]|nr:hypothetical protein [Verrucomicrobiales bacterium]
MDFLAKFFDYSSNGNLRDGFLHEFILAFTIIWLSSLIGLFIGWLMWRGRKRKCAEIEKENARLRTKQTTA